MRPGDVVRVRLPIRGGREQAGTRPAILMQEDQGPQHSPTLVIVPLTSQLAAARFGSTLRLEPGEHTGLRVPSLALVFQITATDRANVIEQLGALEQDEYRQICDAVLQMIQPGGSIAQ